MNHPDVETNPFGDTEVDYPARVAMKARTYSTYTEDEQKSAIRGVLDSLGLEASDWKKKNSNEGKYVSHSFAATITSSAQLEKLYSMLKDLDEVKMLL